MVMRAGPDPRKGALTTVRYRRLGPWWLWAVVAILFGVGAYAAFLAKTSHQHLRGAEAALLDLAEDKDRLGANVADLHQKLEEANRARDETETALKQSRAETDAASALAGELQKRSTALQSEVAAARAGADASKKEVARLGAEAERANVAFTQARNLQERVAALKAEADAARAETDESKKAVERLTTEAAAAGEAESALEREIASLKSQIGEMQQKLDATTASTGTTR